jgi:hypothetical protein
MMTARVGGVRAGWVVYDVSGLKIGKVGRSYRYADEDLMEVRTGFLGLGRRLHVPTTAIRAVVRGRLLLTRSRHEFAALGWLTPPTRRGSARERPKPSTRSVA